MHLIVDSLIDINNLINSLNNVTLGKVNTKPYGCDKIYMDENLIEDEQYQLLERFSKRKINHRDFYFALLDNTYPFCDDNEGTCKILIVGSFGLEW